MAQPARLLDFTIFPSDASQAGANSRSACANRGGADMARGGLAGTLNVPDARRDSILGAFLHLPVHLDRLRSGSIATAVIAWSFRANPEERVLPFRAKRDGSGSPTLMQAIAVEQPLPVLPPIRDRLHLHQAHEGAAEAAGAAITKTQSNV
ncbi:MAG: hypothetical protein ACREB5_09600 [Sphingomonadaceae bacterium]